MFLNTAENQVQRLFSSSSSIYAGHPLPTGEEGNDRPKEPLRLTKIHLRAIHRTLFKTIRSELHNI